LTDLEKLLKYVRVAKQQAAVAGHQGYTAENDAWHMGRAFAYQDIENVLILKIGREANDVHAETRLDPEQG
jgi:hypothetical protein